MLVSHIVPVKALPLISNSRFHMVLANIAVKNQAYKDYYKAEKEKGSFLLLDNGAAESDQITTEEILEVAKYIGADEIVLNDELLNGDETIKKSLESIKYYTDNGYTGGFMFVPQGKNILEWKDCFIKMKDHPLITTFGLSKFATKAWDTDFARILMLDVLLSNGKQNLQPYNVHLLGCHNGLKELTTIGGIIPLLRGINIRSVDTALSYINMLDGVNMLGQRNHKTEIDFIDGEVTNEDLLKSNMITFTNLVK